MSNPGTLIWSTPLLFVGCDWKLIAVFSQNNKVNIPTGALFSKKFLKMIVSNFLAINKDCLMIGIDQHGNRNRLTTRVMTFAITGRGIVMKSFKAIISSAPGFSF